MNSNNFNFFLDSSSSPDKGEIVDWQLTAETEKYELGKRWLATMMGEDVETFTDEKIAVSSRKSFAHDASFT